MASNWPRLDALGPHVFTTGGRISILLALQGIGVGPGDVVMVPTYHCPTMIEPCVLLGALPLFYAIGARGEPVIEGALPTGARRVKALLAAHFFGLPQDFTEVRAFCDRHRMAFIEDCAHAYFGRSSVGPVGTLGDVSIGSLPKFFPLLEGGCMVIRSAALELPRLKSPGLMKDLRVTWDALELGARAGRLGPANFPVNAVSSLKRILRPPVTSALHSHDEELAAACNTIVPARVHVHAASVAQWLVRNANVDRIVRARRSNYEHFVSLFPQSGPVRALFPRLADGAVPYVFPLKVELPESTYKALRALGVPMYRWDLVWPGTPAIPGDFGTRWSTEVYQLACHEDMTADDVEAVAAAIRDATAR